MMAIVFIEELSLSEACAISLELIVIFMVDLLISMFRPASRWATRLKICIRYKVLVGFFLFSIWSGIK